MVYISNRQAKQQYQILDTIRAGISLLGTEVKSIRSGKGSLIGAQILLNGTQIILKGANIPAHQEKNAPTDYDPKRNRNILLTKKELEKLHLQTEAKGLFIIPFSVYNSGSKIKIDIAIAKKKNARDKREEIKKRDLEREQKHV